MPRLASSRLFSYRETMTDDERQQVAALEASIAQYATLAADARKERRAILARARMRKPRP